MPVSSSNVSRAVFLLGCATIALSWQVPGHYPPWVAFQQELVAAVGGALLAWSVVAQGLPIRWPRLAVGALAVASVPLAQRTFGLVTFNSTALLGALYLVGFALSVVVGATLARAEKAKSFIAPLMVALAAGACVSTALALMQWQHVGMPNLWIADLPPGKQPFANLAQPNHLATLLGCGIAAFVYFYESRLIGGLATSFGVGLLGLGLLMTQSRTAWLFIACLTLMTTVFKRRAALRIPVPAAWIGAGLFAIGVVAWGPLNDVLELRSQSLALRMAAGDRSVLWPLMLSATWQRPWLGYGWMQSGQAYFENVLGFEAMHEYHKSAHNIVLDIAIWNGWPLALIIVGALAWWFVRKLHCCRSGEQWAILAAVLAVWAHALVEYPLQYAYFLIPVGLLMGLAEGVHFGKVAPTRSRLSLAAPLAAACALMIWVTLEYVRVEASVRVQRFIDARVGVDKVNRAPALDVVLLDAERTQLDAASVIVGPGMRQDELDSMKKLVEENAFPGPLFRYALALGLNGRPQEASAALATLCKMNTRSRCSQAAHEWSELRSRYTELAGVPPSR